MLDHFCCIGTELFSGASSLTSASVSPPQVVKSRDGFVKARDAFLYCNEEWAVLGNVHIQIFKRSFSALISNFVSENIMRDITRDVCEIKPQVAEQPEVLQNFRQTQYWQSQKEKNWKMNAGLCCGLVLFSALVLNEKEVIAEDISDRVKRATIW